MADLQSESWLNLQITSVFFSFVFVVRGFFLMQQFVMTKSDPDFDEDWALCKKFYHSKCTLCCCATDNGRFPSWQVPRWHFHSETEEVSIYFKTPWKLFKNRESQTASPEHFWVPWHPTYSPEHIKEAESLNAYGLCFSSCDLLSVLMQGPRKYWN